MKIPDIGLKILLALREKGMGQQELARRAGVAQSTISLYIGNKRSPKFGLLVKIARVLDKPISYFTEESDSAAAPASPRLLPVLDHLMLENFDWKKGGHPPEDCPRVEPTESTDHSAFFVKASGKDLTGWADDRKVILEGDLFLVEPGKPVNDGDIVFCRNGDRGVVVMKMRHLSDKIIFLPLNEYHSPVVIKPGEKLEYFRISEIKRKL